jgi:hypothetical protein
MNWFVLVAGLVAAGVVVGHFLMGTKLYLAPMLAADFDAVARKVMHAVFHYVSVFLVLAAVVLLAAGSGCTGLGDLTGAVRFIAVSFLAFAVWQVVLALGSGIKQPLTRMFQWIPFLVIGILALMGTCSCSCSWSCPPQ